MYIVYNQRVYVTVTFNARLSLHGANELPQATIKL